MDIFVPDIKLKVGIGSEQWSTFCYSAVAIPAENDSSVVDFLVSVLSFLL